MKTETVKPAERNKTKTKDGEKNSMCSQCGMLFKCDYDVKKHMVVHQTERWELYRF